MNTLITSIVIFVLISGIVSVTFYKLKDIKKINILIYVSIFGAWLSLYMFKSNPHLGTKSILSDQSNWWIWPIIVSVFQFTQVATRIPLGKLSQKLKSRKKPITLVMIILLLGLTLVIFSNFALWSIIVAIVCLGIYGAAFSMDAQYFSENWNIKRVFVTSAIVFTLPTGASTLGTIFNYSFIEADINLYWVTFIAITILVFTIIFYTIKVKEDKNTIGLDNQDPNAVKFNDKSWKDIASLSITAASVVAAFTFVNQITKQTGITFESVILSSIQLGAAVIATLMITHKVNARLIRIISQYITLVLLLVVGVLYMNSSMDKNKWIILMSLANVSFGIFILTMFASALHFDHKYPALVLGIFLTIKSAATGVGQISGDLLRHELSSYTIGIISISIVIAMGILSMLAATLFVFGDGKHVDNVIIDSAQFENISK